MYCVVKTVQVAARPAQLRQSATVQHCWQVHDTIVGTAAVSGSTLSSYSALRHYEPKQGNNHKTTGMGLSSKQMFDLSHSSCPFAVQFTYFHTDPLFRVIFIAIRNSTCNLWIVKSQLLNSIQFCFCYKQMSSLVCCMSDSLFVAN